MCITCLELQKTKILYIATAIASIEQSYVNDCHSKLVSESIFSIGFLLTNYNELEHEEFILLLLYVLTLWGNELKTIPIRQY